MNVTQMSHGTFGVTHGPITRSDPNRSDPALLQKNFCSPFTTSFGYVPREHADGLVNLR